MFGSLPCIRLPALYSQSMRFSTQCVQAGRSCEQRQRAIRHAAHAGPRLRRAIRERLRMPDSDKGTLTSGMVFLMPHSPRSCESRTFPILCAQDRVGPLPLHSRDDALNFRPSALQHDPLAVLTQSGPLVALDLVVSAGLFGVARGLMLPLQCDGHPQLTFRARQVRQPGDKHTFTMRSSGNTRLFLSAFSCSTIHPWSAVTDSTRF